MFMMKVIGNNWLEMHPSNQFRQGQIIKGRVKRILPNHLAEIIIGRQTILAQIEAPLVAGEQYFFQVLSLRGQIHLKVIAESSKQPAEDRLQTLLSYLQIPNHKGNQNFLQFLMDHQIPFQHSQLKKALTILQGEKDKGLAHERLAFMFIKNLPITQGTYDALATIQTDSFTNLLKQLIANLDRKESLHPIEQQLYFRAQHLLVNQHENILSLQTEKFFSEIAKNRDLFIQLFQILGINKQESPIANPVGGDVFAERLSNVLNTEMMINTDLDLIVERLSLILREQKPIFETVQQLMRNWHQMIHQALTEQTLLSEQQFQSFQNEFYQSLVSYLPALKDKSVTNDFSFYQESIQTMNVLSNVRIYQYIDYLLSHLQINEPTIKNMFIHQLKAILQFTGLSDEYNIANDLVNPHFQTFKTLLRRFVHGNHIITERYGEQLLQFITGLQLLSYEETNGIIELSLQIPGKKLFLKEDVHLQFTGRKNEKGQIDPDFCRILFFLELDHLKQTIVDLNIQNRYAQITIYNDQEGMHEKFFSFQPYLRNQLKNYAYELVSITVETIKKDDKLHKPSYQQPITNKNSFEGIDFRI